MKWTDEQLKIINHSNKKILVRAGAGTGKTAVIIQRVLQLLKNEPKLNIDEIAIITFTNKATEEIQSRLKTALYREWRFEKDLNRKIRLRNQLEALNSAQISTIHKFCQSILEEIGPYFDRDIAYSPNFKISSSRLIDSIEYTIENWIQDVEESGDTIEHFEIMPVHVFKNIVIKLYTDIRSKGLNMNQIIRVTEDHALFESSPVIRKLRYELISVLLKLQENHKDFKHGRMDVDDLLELTANILKKRTDLLAEVQKRFKHIIVDEFQDTSLYQSEIIMSICDNSDKAPYLLIVGDSKQSIYGFRGADLNAYMEIERWIKKEGTVLGLQTNWRSVAEVVYFVNYVFQNIKESSKYEFFHESLKPHKDKEEIDITKAYKWIYGKKEDHGYLVGKFLKDEIEKGKKLGDYAVLVRNNYQLSYIEKGLKENNIFNYEIIGSGSFYNQIEIIDAFKVLNFLIQPNDRFLFKEACDTMYFKKDELKLKGFLEKVKLQKLIYEFTPAQLLDFLFKESEIDNSCSTIQEANLNKLKEISRETFFNEHITLRQYIAWLDSMIVSNQDEPIATPMIGDNDRIKVMTIHRAKGLEFEYVILPFLNETFSRSILYPEVIIDQNSLSIEFNYRKRYSTDNTKFVSRGYDEAVNNMQYDMFSEELRVLYVALTRAKKKLILFGDQDNKNKENYQSWITGN